MDASIDSGQRAFNWLAGNRLSDILHIGDHELAYRFSEQGHEVVVVAEDAQHRAGSHVTYVRGSLNQLPFIAKSFDLIVCPSLRVSATQAAGMARVLRPEGHVATVSRSYDETIPWVRRLLTITGAQLPSLQDETVSASGLFFEPETKQVADWVELDLPSTIQFARSLGGASFGDEQLAQVRALFAQSAPQTDTLRLRHSTEYLRARVDKTQLPDDDTDADTTLFDLR